MPKRIFLVAPDGDDLVFYGQSLDDLLIAGNGRQTLYGTAGNDTLIGGTGDQKLYGGSDNDTIIAGFGNQTLDGGAGVDVLDLSRLSGHVEVDLDLYFAKLTNPATGDLLAQYTVTSFNTVIGNDTGNKFWASEYTPRLYVGGAGDDVYRSESGGDTVTMKDGNDVFHWCRKYVADGLTDRITDFTVGQDKLDIEDFLKGQTIKYPTADQVIRLYDTVDATGDHGTLVQGLVDGQWLDMVVLDHVKAASVTVTDLVI